MTVQCAPCPALPEGAAARFATSLAVPGSDIPLVYERDEATGTLLSIQAAGRVYFTREADGRQVYGDNLANLRETRFADGFDREVTAADGHWTERYRWDESGKLVEVDGVRVHRDEQGRVTALVNEAGPIWTYAYGPRGLAGIDTPSGRRTVGRDRQGRVCAVSGDGLEQSFRWDAEGRRRDAATLPPKRYLRDNAGRVCTVLAPGGSIEAVFLWDGFRCLARIDGAPGAPLGAVFSLDPSATPVRIITPAESIRVPRDAFGEGLMEHHLVPGLFGGTVYEGLVHLPLRALDPRVGAFCAPDPLTGEADDPRRGDRGIYRGPLAAEPDEVSPWAVCRDDPVGRGDPTGGVSGWLIFSDITWSLQNNLVSFFGVDWWFNLFFSLFTGFQLGDFGSSEGLSSSPRMGAFGLRRDGFIGHITGGRAFTTQHIVWSPAEEFELLQRPFAVDPKGAWEPTLYGTLLRGRPQDQTPFLLRGMREQGGNFADAGNWSRQGGRGVPVCPGATAPRFPAGGFHLPEPLEGLLAPLACPLDELAPGGPVAVGTLNRRATMLVPLGGALPAANDLVLLADDADLLITQVASSSQQATRQLLRFHDDAPAIGPTGVTLTLLDNAPVHSESLGLEGAVSNALTAVGTTGTYAPNDLLRLTEGANVSAVRVERLEARLPLDRPLPAGMSGPIQIRSTTVAPSSQSVSAVGSDRLDFSGATVPPAPSMGLVVGGGQSIPVRVIDTSNPAQVQVDTDISAAGAGPVDFFTVTAGNAIGERADSAEPESRVSYRPQSPGAAPDGSAGTVVLRFEGSGGPAVRRVTGAAAYDAIVLDRAPAGAGPFTVERFVRRAGSVDLRDREIAASASLVAEPAETVDGASALRLDLVAEAAGSPGIPAVVDTHYAGFTVNGVTATGNSTPGNQPAEPRPGQVVLISGAGTDTPAVVQRLRLTPTFDRVLDVTAGDDISAVLLQATGFEYEATRLADDRLVVAGRALSPGGAVDVALPRFGVGETVEVNWSPHGTADRDRFRISAVSGTIITLEGGSALSATRSDLRVRRLVPIDPENGSELLARDGTAATAPGDQIEFSVWQPNAFPADRVVGIVQGERTLPAVVTSATQDVRIDFGAHTGLAGNGNITSVNVLASMHAVSFVRDGDALLVVDDTSAVATAAGQLVLVTAYTANGSSAANAELSGGTLRVPQDESVEIDRRQSLTDHELAHTLQYSLWGPLWFCYFPMLVLELPVELATDAERPAYGPFFSGTVTTQDQSWELAVSGGDTSGVGVGNTLQVVQGASVVSVEVSAIDGSTLRLRRKSDGGAPPTGAVQCRRRNPDGAWSTVFDVLQFFTHGGLLNGVVGTTWGGILWCLGKLFWGLGRAIAGTGDHYPGSVRDAERRIVRLSTPEGQSGLADATQFIIRQGEVSVVRDGSLASELLTLEEPLSFDGEVQVAVYASLDPGNAFAWFSYHPGSVPDEANPLRIEVPGHGGDFSEHDRIEISYRDRTFRSNVTAVNGDLIDIEDRVEISEGETSLRVAVVGAGDPMGQADSYLATELGMGWMRWLFDPWGRIDVAVGQDPRWLNVILRTVRYLMGTQMWSMLPVLGYVFWGRFFVSEHLAVIEQEASEESGDLYSPLSRLHGEARKTDDYGRYEMVVGDIARFTNWTLFRESSMVDASLQGAPGVRNQLTRLRLIVDRRDGTASADPNGAVETDSSTAPAAALYDRFTAKNATDPQALDAITNPAGFIPSDLGHLPDAATTVRHVGCYASFTRPGNHRITVENGLDPSSVDPQPATDAREVQERERQTIFFDISVRDVIVTVNGQPVTEGDTIELVHTQEALVTVAPDGVDLGPRRFRATVLQPEDSPVLRARNDRRLIAQDTDGTGEIVEVCRFFAFDSASASYTDAALSAFGTHLGGDLFVPVRRFAVNVVSTLPLRATADPAAAALTELAQGADAILLVPANVRGAVTVSSFDGRAPAAGDPTLSATRLAEPGDAVSAFLGGAGSAFTLRFADDPALAGPVPVVVEIPVGVSGGLASTLTASFQLRPA